MIELMQRFGVFKGQAKSISLGLMLTLVTQQFAFSEDTSWTVRLNVPPPPNSSIYLREDEGELISVCLFHDPNTQAPPPLTEPGMFTRIFRSNPNELQQIRHGWRARIDAPGARCEELLKAE